MTWTRSTCLLMVAVTAVVLRSPAFASPPAFAQSAPSRSALDELETARRAIDGLAKASSGGDAARRLDEVTRDFNDFYTTYMAQARRAPGETGVDAPGGSWRLKLAIVNTDLRAASEGFDQPTMDRLNEVRVSLDRFYNAAIALEELPPDAGTALNRPAPVTAMPSSLALLDRMQKLIAGLLAAPVNGSDSDSTGRVTVDRATLVELQTAVTELQMLAQSTGSVAPR